MSWLYNHVRLTDPLSPQYLRQMADEGWWLVGVRRYRSRRRHRVHRSRFARKTYLIFAKRKEEKTNMRQENGSIYVEAGIWRHYKGDHYQVLGIGAHSETDERMVIYVALEGIDKPGPRIRLRPLSMWFDQIEIKPPEGTGVGAGAIPVTVQRFTFVGAEMPK